MRRKTAKARFGRALQRLAQWCSRYRHLPICEQQRALNRKLQGHYGYYGVTGNARALARFRRMAARIWRTWLNRRSQRAHMTWPRFIRLLQHYPLQPARVVHSVDPVGRAAVLTRLARLGLGNPGDVKPVGAGVWELRVDVGPGYRAYYMRAGESVYLMLGGGDKSSQAKDVDRAIRMAAELKSAARAKKARKPK